MPDHRVNWAVLLLTTLIAGCAATGPKPGAGPGPYAAFPCLGATLPCGRIATRAPVRKEPGGPLNGDAARGKLLAEGRNKGNCLACHAIKGGAQPGTRGPDLSRYAAAGRSDAETYALVYDMRARVPGTLMPPFGTNGILTDPELRDVVAYLQTLK